MFTFKYCIHCSMFISQEKILWIIGFEHFADNIFADSDKNTKFLYREINLLIVVYTCWVIYPKFDIKLVGATAKQIPKFTEDLLLYLHSKVALTYIMIFLLITSQEN